MRINIEIGDIEAFIEVAETNSFAKAASNLNLSQPALSRRIQKLEYELGTSLFDRTTRSVQLSYSGRNFLERAKSIIEAIQTATKTLNEKYTFPSIVKIAAVNTALKNIIFPTIKLFKEQNPNSKIQIIEKSANYVVDSVLGGECDFAINFMGLQEPGIEFEPLFEEEYVVVFPKGDELEKKRKIKISDIKGRDFIAVWKGSGSRIYFEDALAKHKETLEWTYEVRHVPNALEMVEQGMGITLAPRLAISKQYKGLSFRTLIDPKVSRVMGLIKRSGRNLTFDSQQLYDLLKQRYLKN
ncbi:MAG: LysR family transcriptional regulator [Alphaproteobacteria bacterium]|jgi:DNA-binding transcriptional LysR family regulator|tara:strand:+ start:3172 stop:4065 length:894 start_codon:yes stop_codon:yes gene_type:complete